MLMHSFYLKTNIGCSSSAPCSRGRHNEATRRTDLANVSCWMLKPAASRLQDHQATTASKANFSVSWNYSVTNWTSVHSDPWSHTCIQSPWCTLIFCIFVWWRDLLLRGHNLIFSRHLDFKRHDAHGSLFMFLFFSPLLPVTSLRRSARLLK